ncbi:MAG: DASS family sodium-coupled anion symporter [Bryobacterales bacterium]|nr:anion permease [Bryobacteraceae bacterium]MDW8131466.1 DASS family sodium-coupled anion symporter [Bryobacterales bacterium]
MKQGANQGARTKTAWWRVAVPLALLVGIGWLLPHPATITREGWRLLAVFAAAVAGLVLQPLPGGALVLVAVTLSTVWGGLTLEQALSGYANESVWLVLAAFFISRALIKTGLARRIALGFVRWFGRTSLGVCYALSLSDMVLASIIPSNAARSGGVILPIVRSVAELYGSRPGPTAGLLGAFLMVAVYQSICVTAAMFMTGQASNPMAAQIASESFGYRVDWMSWFLAGIVPGLCSLLIVPLLVYRLRPPLIRRTPEAEAFARRELEAMGPIQRREWLVLAVFLGVCGAWMTARWHGLDITVTALLGACALLVTGVLSWEDVKDERAAWDIFIWYGGLLMLGKALNAAGVTTAFAKAVGGAFGGAGWVTLLAIALPVYFYSHYAYASITAHILAMYSPFLAVLAAQGAPLGLIVYAFACFTNLSAGLTHYGTTPAPMYFAHGYATLGEWWRTGALVSLANLATWSTVGFFWWKLLGIW